MTLEIQQKSKKQLDTRSGYIHSTPLNLPDSFPAALKSLSQIKTRKTLKAIVVDWAIICGCFTLYVLYPSVWLAIFLMFLIAGRQHALLVLMHDGSHYRLFKKHIWNDRISNWFLCYPFFISTEGYRTNHLAHHWYLYTNKDPDWMRKKGKKDWTFPMSQGRFIALLLRDIFGGGLLDQFRAIFNLNKQKDVSVAKVPSKLFEKTFYYVFLISLITLFDFWKPVLLLWVVPSLTLLPAILRLRNMARHFGLEKETDFNMSRNYYPSLLERIFIAPHNVGYHLDHHLYPSVPFYNLPQLHKILEENPDYQKGAHQNGGLFMDQGKTVLKDITR